MKYEKVILVTPENADEQAQFESEYPNLQYYSFRTIKTFVVPIQDANLVKGEVTSDGVLVKNYHVAVNILNDYYGIEVPDSILVSTIGKNPVLKGTIIGGKIEDPENRLMLVNALLRELGEPAWPAYGTDPKAVQNFQINLSLKLAHIGGKLKYKRV